jgi:hypothetical protein
MNKFKRIFSNQLWLNMSVLLLAAVVITLPIFFFGIPNGNDLPQHYQFAVTFLEALQNGSLYPGWSGNSNFGFGDVGIRFYPPLSYYVLIFFHSLTGNWYDASVFTFCFWFFLGGVGVYLWAREWFGENASLSAGVLYIFAPYHANEIYNAFFFAEFAAASLLPFCFLFVTRICRDGKTADIIGLSIFYALLVLTHLPMTVIGSIGLAVYSLASLNKKHWFSSLAKLSVAGIVGLAASAFYWVRMVSELGLVKHATEEFTTNAYDFHANFLAAFLYVSPTQYSDRSLWFADLMLLMTAALFVPSAIIFYLKTRGKIEPKLYNVACLVVFAVFISTPLSLFIWERFGILQKVQFPWRWLAIISVGGVIFAAAGFDYLLDAFKTKMRPLALIAVGLAFAAMVFTAAQVIKQAVYTSRPEFSKKITQLSDSESYECWWAIWSKKEAFDNKEKVSINDRKVEINIWQPLVMSFSVSAGEAQTARIAVFYYPHWQAAVNNEQIQIVKDDDGTILIPITNEKSEVKLVFIEPAYVKSANFLSLTVWFIFLIFSINPLMRKIISGKITTHSDQV